MSQVMLEWALNQPTNNERTYPQKISFCTRTAEKEVPLEGEAQAEDLKFRYLAHHGTTLRYILQILADYSIPFFPMHFVSHCKIYFHKLPTRLN